MILGLEKNWIVELFIALGTYLGKKVMSSPRYLNMTCLKGISLGNISHTVNYMDNKQCLRKDQL